ncbi:putative bifunctional diguanylate cyclase/phosphodiesterase [Orrella marina]|nr:EAL domain-containing protein [Orrella marina]
MKTIKDSLELQVWLYILFVSSLLTGTLGLVGNTWPELSVPDSLMVTSQGAIALILGGIIMMSLLLGLRSPRLSSGVLLLLMAVYSLLENVFVSILFSGVPWIADLSSLASLPAACVALLGLLALLGLDTVPGRTLARFVGLVGIGVGLVVMYGYVFEPPQQSDELVLGFSRMTSVFCIGFGIGLMLLAMTPDRPSLRISAPAAVIGALSISATFGLLLIASWGSHAERHLAARAVLEQQVTLLQREMYSSVGLIERLADRWASLNMSVPMALQRVEVQRYLTDVPSLRALAVTRNGEQFILTQGKSFEDQAWLEQVLSDPQGKRWVQNIVQSDIPYAWHITDPASSLMTILLVRPTGSPQNLFFASFDLQALLNPLLHAGGQEYEFALESTDPTSEPEFSHGHGHPNEVYESMSVSITNGPTFYVSSYAGPVNMLSLRGALVPGILIFGVLVSYLLTMASSLASIQRRKSHELSVEEQRLRSLFSQSPDAVFEFSNDGTYQSLNRHARAITGIKDSDLGIVNYHDFLDNNAMSKRDYAMFDSAFETTVGGTAQNFSVTFLNFDDESRDYEISFVPILVDGRVQGVYAVVKDVTERLLARENQHLLTRSLESSDSAVLVVDVRKDTMPVVFVNAAFTDVTGFSKEEVMAGNLSLLISMMEEADDVEAINRAMENGQAASLTVKSYRRSGAPFWNQLSLTPVRDVDGNVTHYTAIMKDVSEMREQAGKLAYQATHDVLTGLPNRTLFEDRLEHDIAMCQRKGTQLAVLFVDLDEFKPINDALGHRVGDEVLISVARSLQEVVGPADTLARFGGDEFVLLLPNLSSVAQAERMAEMLLTQVGQPHRVAGNELYVTASVGISLLSEGHTSARLLQQADIAMYKAKQQGRDTYAVYAEDLNESLSMRVTLRNELQEAIRQEQLHLNYQPQVDQAGRICGIEALVRWRHPVKGFISPAEFIPVAEETGQIIQLGRWVTTQTCRDAKQLLDIGLLTSRVAVNLSTLQFHRPGFVASLLDILKQTDLPPTYLELELTESILMRNSETAIGLLHILRDKGISASIDDFGTGYSSFSYLKDLPVESVKIDKTFVDNVTTDRKDAAVCKGIITMAREMGMKVIAEGVETREQFELLKGFGCDMFQGYYFARPMSFEKLVDWMKSGLPDSTK